MLFVRFRWMVFESKEDCRMYKSIIEGFTASDPALAISSTFAVCSVRAQYDLADQAAHIIPDCRSINLVVQPFDGGSILLLNKWAHYPSLIALSLEMSAFLRPPSGKRGPTLVTNPNITTLHIYYPFIKLNIRPTQMFQSLLKLFPSIHTLSVSGPFPLTHLLGSVPPVDTIILERPPMEYSAESEHSLAMYWSIVGAVAGGLFQRRSGKEGKKNRLILHAKMDLPKGWDNIVESCRKVGVDAIGIVGN